MSYLYDPAIATDATLGLFWEVYDPPVDSSGVAHLEITIDVRDAARRPLLARVVRAVGRVLAGDAPVAEVRYEQVAPVTDHRVINWIRLAAAWQRG